MNRYSLLAIVVIIIVVITTFFDLPNNDNHIEMIGFAADISESRSGFVFYIHLENGDEIKAFYSQRPDDSLHSFSGKYSEDGNIFFVSNIRDC